MSRQLALDHLIFSLQATGGISNWWINHLKCIDIFDLKSSLHFNLDSLRGKDELPFSLLDLGGDRFSYERKFNKYLWPIQGICVPDFVTTFHSSYFRPIAASSSCRVIVTWHDGSSVSGAHPKAIAHRWLQSRCLRRADVVHCVSHHAAKELSEAFSWMPREKISVIYHGFSSLAPPLPCIKINLDIPYVLFVGRRGGYKNGLMAIEAISLLKDQKIRLVFVGGGPPSRSELKRIDQLNLASRISFLGNAPASELHWLYDHALSLWYPSTNEGFGFPVLEAADSGCPVLAVSGHSVQEIAPDYCEFTNCPSPQWLANKTEDVMKNFNRKDKSKSGGKLAATFSWGRYGEQMKEVYGL